MKKIKKYGIPILLLLVLAFIYYYVTLPAINLHSVGFWYFIIGVFAVITIFVAIKTGKNVKNPGVGLNGVPTIFMPNMKNKFFKICFILSVGVIGVFLIGTLLSSPIVNASKYQKLISINERVFTEDITEVNYNEIPLLDKESAAILGTRKLGNMVEYVSQFEVSDNYTQINYQEEPYRVTPLRYGSTFKWLGNMKNGIPAYIRINMATQDVECVKLNEGIRYSESDHFGRNIYRYLRFRYPTAIFDTLSFEINDEGIPYWICPIKDFTIGLFGGQKISGAVLVNAVTGEHDYYDIKNVPTWVDRVYSADLLVSYYDYYGTLKNGYLNTLFSQKGCLKTTAGYNYLALEDDVWVYTGVTSVSGDRSNVGFVLMNQRTAETRYYPISGAEEFSAMTSAEGKVQHLGYKSTFPLLLNIANEPTYFMALKDASGLVKNFAMVNIEKYTIVSVGNTVQECEKAYIAQLKSSGITTSDVSTMPTVTGIIEKIAQSVVDGNSHYYVMLQNNDAIFDVLVSDYMDILRYDIGDSITFSYMEGQPANIVGEIRK